MKVTVKAPHGDKLEALLMNEYLPEDDVDRVKETQKRYKAWVADLKDIRSTDKNLLSRLVTCLNEYKRHIELELVFDSPRDFLYRQKGQTKLDNSILEEFLPYLFDVRLVPGFARLKNLECGPQSSFAGLSFGSPFLSLKKGGVFVKKKDQDFAVSKTHQITITDGAKSGTAFETEFLVSHFATEIKTNLDKTMFQEASQTAAELKRAVPGSRCVLLCEFLDMTPITTKLTSIDEVIVLRKAKRLGSQVRGQYKTAAGRQKGRKDYEDLLVSNPLRLECFERFIWHLNECFPEKEEDAEDIVLDRGYF